MPSATTKERILDAAERLFAEKGVDATSLRQVTGAAGVNVAAIHYHFGSKEELLRAVIARRFDPVNQERLKQLDRLEVVVSVEGDAIVVRTEQPSDTQGRTFEVEYNLIIPERLKGNITNVNGNILIDAMDDDVEVITVNGNITLQDHFGSADVTSTNGNLDATVTISLGGVIDMNAVNGSIDLDIPASTSATFAARVANGDISTSNLSLDDAQSTPVSLTGVLGDGDGEIDIETVNGNIVLQGF